MKYTLKLLSSQQGSIMLIAVMVFFIVSLLGTVMMGIASMESKISINDIRAEQARQAADAGVAIARDVVRNCLIDAKEPQPFSELELSNGTLVQIELRDDKDDEDLIWITSTGKYQSSTANVTYKTAEAGICAEFICCYPSQSLEAMGRNFIPVSNHLSYAQHIEHYRQLAQLDSDWQYIDQYSDLLEPLGNNRFKVIIDNLNRKKAFIERPLEADKEKVVVLDFKTERTCTGISIVCPTNLEIGIDSLLFEEEDSDACLFLLGGQDISLSINPAIFNGMSRTLSNQGSDDHNIAAFIMAGRDLTICSTPQNLTIRGILNAANQIAIKMDYFEEDNSLSVGETENQINIIKDFSVIKKFPESWAYLSLASIVSYRYLD